MTGSPDSTTRTTAAACPRCGCTGGDDCDHLDCSCWTPRKSAPAAACERIGCNKPGTIPIHAPLTQNDSLACEQHIDQMLAIGWQRTGRFGPVPTTPNLRGRAG